VGAESSACSGKPKIATENFSSFQSASLCSSCSAARAWWPMAKLAAGASKQSRFGSEDLTSFALHPAIALAG
jgi:hypothetical protein